MGLLHRLIPWAYSVDEHEAYYIGLLISTHVLRNKHVLINKPTLDERTPYVSYFTCSNKIEKSIF